MTVISEGQLGSYLKACRAKLDPATFGFPLARRRTPGLRREEVAQRAHVSATWYTWLEQGRGGAPSPEVLDRRARQRQSDWHSVARFVVASFRTDVLRAGASQQVATLVDELSQQSAEFAAMWSEHDVRAHGEGTKRLQHPQAGELSLEYSAFAVDGHPDLGMVIYNPATPADAARIRKLIKAGVTGTAASVDV